MNIKNECVVAIHYTLTNSEGRELDSSGNKPLVYLHGSGNLIKGLEQELDGRAAGDSFKTVIEPALAYGEVDARLIQDIPRTLVANIENLHVGMMLQSRSEDDHLQQLIVDEIGDDTVKLNANHPLAGVTLHFDVTIDSIREATPEEIEHGHAH